MNHETQWPDDAPEWADALNVIYSQGECTVIGRHKVITHIERPKPKNYCGVCGEWFGGPVECCGESHLKPPVTKDEAIAVRAARKPAKQKCKCCGQEIEAWNSAPRVANAQWTPTKVP